MSCPLALVQIAIEPRHKRDLPALHAALATLPAEDTGSVLDEESGHIVLESDSEARLDAAVALLRERLDLDVGAPQIAYRETIARRVEMDTMHKKPVAGGFEFARVKFVFEPAAASSFVSRLPEGGFPPDLAAGAARGIEIARCAGVLAGFPVVDVAATLVDGAYHDRDSTPAAFETAAITAFRHAQSAAGLLLEPIMRVELIAPAAYAGAMRNDLLVRRGEVDRPTRDEGIVAIEARVPLANLLGYRSTLSRLTQGDGRMTMAFSHFAPIEPPEPPQFPGAMALRSA